MTAQDLLHLKVIDEIIPEPPGGAHRNPSKMAEGLAKTLSKHLRELESLPQEERLQARYNRLRKIGTYSEEASLPKAPPSS
jgi:acetyl-CoA carboxylase carboxyl transferase subunit alpha